MALLAFFFHGDPPLGGRDPAAGLCVSSRTALALSYMTALLCDQTPISCSDRVPLSLPEDAAGDTLQQRPHETGSLALKTLPTVMLILVRAFYRLDWKQLQDTDLM